ncbi:MAG: pseudouridine synthase [Paracoccus sp. (in: a-proteobacteria)]|nr:pseudouridine synthase [Paracoccus sp. (in: a-proteobacteria)]MDO5371731.1 pseudouridine synthase [Paracoccus sp. (in: a-proteobacteria)]
MARAGVASRREAERMIVEGRVTVNGRKIASPALDVLPSDKVTVDGKPMEAAQETRLWLYYKPVGLVTSEADEKGRQTVFDALPRDLPRVMSVGRLDLNSEGLLLLTNDGELKRRLELPSTGWLRRYRVRVNGQPNDLTFDPLRRGATIEGEEFAPMEIKLDSQQGANAWLTVGIREGRNREIRRAMAHVGLIVNRLIRIGYGPFKLIGMEENEVREVKRRVLRDQLGGLLTGDADATEERGGRPARSDSARGSRRDDRAPRRDGDGERQPRREGDRRPWAADRAEKDRTPRKPRHGSDGGDRPARAGAGRSGTGEGYDRKPRAFGADRRDEGTARGPRQAGFDRRGEGHPDRESGFTGRTRAGEGGERGPRPPGRFGRPGDGSRPEGDKRPRAPRAEGGSDRRGFAPRPDGGDRPRGPRPQGERPRADRPHEGGRDFDRDRSDRVRSDQPRGDRKPWAAREDRNGTHAPRPPREGGPRTPRSGETESGFSRKPRAARPDRADASASQGDRPFRGPRPAGAGGRPPKPGTGPRGPAPSGRGPGGKPGRDGGSPKGGGRR